jgi:hypothetical protein
MVHPLGMRLGGNGNKKFWEELIAYFPHHTDSIENEASNNPVYSLQR